ncbi:MAG: hypothetical protein U1A78_24565 [Polyangia bacterium]
MLVALALLSALSGARAQSAEPASPDPASPSPAQSQAQSQAQTQLLLLDGVRAFRAEQYDSALVLFRRIESAAARPDIGFYLGMVLHKLGRHGEALVAFRAAQRAGLSESVADYYRAVSCFRLGQLERARAGFRALLQPSPAPGAGGPDPAAPPLGPRLLQGAERFVAAIERAAPSSPDPARPETEPRRRFEAALQKADSLTVQSDAEAQEWLEEAALLVPALAEPERAAALTRFHAILARVQKAAHGPAAAVRTTELGALWQSVRASSHR